MSEHEHDDTIIHLDALVELAERAAAMHAVTPGNELDYDRMGVCTTDLLYVANKYGAKVVREVQEQGGDGATVLTLQFLAGFDIGYQARLELETREAVDNAKDFDY